MSTALSLLDQHIIGRTDSFFAEDLAGHHDTLTDEVRGARLLVLGGAGSIGSHTLRTMLGYRPASVHVIDHNENELAELVRSVRSAPHATEVGELQTMPFDIGGSPFRLWLEANEQQYDMVLNFAALKHVRSEKDPYSILAMLETNVLHLDRMSELFEQRRGLRRVFSVSTDKAANPSSMMGATKRLMEHALFSPSTSWAADVRVTSARFANVAFSNGSLLQAWQRRLAARQPLACPIDCRRFFVSLDESGHLCTLAACATEHRSLAIPSLDQAQHLVLLSDVVARFLEFHGFEMYATTDEEEAKARVDELASARKWPVLLTPLDTAGEKPYEEFIGEGEHLRAPRFAALGELVYRAPADPESFPALVSGLRDVLYRGGPRVTESDIKEWIAKVEPAFASTHRASPHSLDQRM